MKRFFLFLAAAVISISASAQTASSLKVQPNKTIESKLAIAPIAKVQGYSGVEREIARKLHKPYAVKQAPAKAPAKAAAIEPKGEFKWYSWSGYMNTIFGMMYTSGLADQVAIDGNDVYIKSLFPGSYVEQWTKGTLNEEGTEITIPMNQIVGEYDYGGMMLDLTVRDAILTEEGYVDHFQELKLTKDGDHIYVDDDPTAPEHYIFLYASYDGEDVGYLDYTVLIDLQPVEGDLDPVTVPETAETAQYVYSYTDSYGYPVSALGTVAKDGQDIYFSDLASGAGWVKGTRLGATTVRVKKQYVSADLGYYLYFVPGTNMDTDYYIYDEAASFDLTLEAGTYTQKNEGDYAVLATADDGLFDFSNGFKIEPFTGLKPAVPSDPADVFLSDYTDDYGQTLLQFSVPTTDTNGKYIAPENLEVALYIDGDILTLSAEDGYSLNEDIDWMPFGWTDLNGGYDLDFSSINPMFWLYEDLFDEIGVQVRYTVGGITQYSNIVYADMEGNTRAEEVEHPSYAFYAEGADAAAVGTKFVGAVTNFVNPYADPAVIKVYDSADNVVAVGAEISDNYKLADYSCDETIVVLDKALVPGNYTIKFPAGTVVMGEGVDVDFNQAEIAVEFAVTNTPVVLAKVNDVDAINSVSVSAAKGEVYNLAGQRVSKMQKGLYIQKGQKFMNK